MSLDYGLQLFYVVNKRKKRTWFEKVREATTYPLRFNLKCHCFLVPRHSIRSGQFWADVGAVGDKCCDILEMFVLEAQLLPTW